MSPATDGQPSRYVPSLSELFTAFFGVSIVGFGGVMPWARRMLVERRKWIDDTEFAEALALAQFLPGGNIVNMAVALGQTYHGWRGSLAAVAGLLVGPILIVTMLMALFLRYGQNELVSSALAGSAAGAAGLLLSMAAKMARPLIRRSALVPLGLALATFAMVGVAKLPLVPVILVLAPIGVAYAWWRLP